MGGEGPGVLSEISLRERVVIVTGAGGGLGRTFCVALAQAGALVVAADIDLAASRRAAQAADEAGAETFAVEVDVADPESTLAMAAAASERFGGIDVLVNNAALFGHLQRVPFNRIDPAIWDRVMSVNAKGPWLCTAAVFPHMIGRGGGSVVNIASATFFSGSPLLAHYVASKGAVIALTRTLARELGQYDIRVNAIAPGFTMTAASRQVFPDAENYSWQRGAIARPEQPEDLVGALLFLASDASAFVTGQCLVVDGGREFN
jgi:NAD(P)-dependent dehydrogenase (short-subunit alcohol dehydrogenase family)